MTSATWPALGASGSDAKPAARRATSGPKTNVSSTTPAIAAGTATAIAAPASTSADGRGVGAARAQQGDRAAPLARGHRQRLHERVEADEPDREADAAQHRGEHGEERGVVGLRRADGLQARAEVHEVAGHGGRVRAGAEPDDDLRVEVRPQLEQPVGLHPRDPPVVLERAHDPADAEADLAALGDLRREHRSGPQPERVGEPDADLDLVRSA